MRKLKVLFDVKRLIDAEKRNHPHWGINRYAIEIFQQLNRNFSSVDIQPIYLTSLNLKTKSPDSIHSELKAIRSLSRKLGKKIIIRNRSRSFFQVMRIRFQIQNLTEMIWLLPLPYAA